MSIKAHRVHFSWSFPFKPARGIKFHAPLSRYRWRQFLCQDYFLEGANSHTFNHGVWDPCSFIHGLHYCLSWVFRLISPQEYFRLKAQPRWAKINRKSVSLCKIENEFYIFMNFSHQQWVCISPLLADRELESNLHKAPLSEHGWR